MLCQAASPYLFISPCSLLAGCSPAGGTPPEPQGSGNPYLLPESFSTEAL